MSTGFSSYGFKLIYQNEIDCKIEVMSLRQMILKCPCPKPETRVFHQVLADENGNSIVRHDIWRAKRIAVDPRIPVGGSRLEVFRWSESVVKTQVRLLWRDLPSGFNAWVLGSGDDKNLVHLIQELRVLR